MHYRLPPFLADGGEHDTAFPFDGYENYHTLGLHTPHDRNRSSSIALVRISRVVAVGRTP